MKTLILQIGFRLPVDLFSTMYRYWEQTFTENKFEINIIYMLQMWVLVTSSIISEMSGVLKHL